MFAYCGNNPVNRVDSTGMFWKEICKLANDFVKTTWKICQSAFAIPKGIEMKAGYGTGFRGSVKVIGNNVSFGAKADLLTVKLDADKIDLGKEFLADARVDIGGSNLLSMGAQTGFFESGITGKIEEYDKNANTSFNIVGIDLYLLIGIHAEVDYNYQRVWNEIIKIWS